MGVPELLIVLMFLTFIALLFTGYPIGFVLGGVAMLFALLAYLSDQYLGTTIGIDFNVLGMIINRVYKLMSNWVLVAIPMFIFMGLMLDESGVAEKMMKSMQDLFGKVHGGLAITVAMIGIILAASTGIVGASVVLLAVLTLPAMLSQGYSKTLSLGVVAASGTLGILIPPSIMLVLMADQLTLSVGDLVMGACSPGVVLGLLYIGDILLRALFRPHTLPRASDRRPLTGAVVLDVVRTVLPSFLLIFITLGSIFAGMATPTEASGVGALGATVLAFWNRRLTFGVVKKVAIDTYKTCGFIFGVFVGATAFALVLRLMGGDELIQGLVKAIPLGPYFIILVILFAIFLMGFFLDWIEICLIMLPLLAPVIQDIGIKFGGYPGIDKPELVWFTVLVAITLQTSFLTPPVGFSIFFLQGVMPPSCTLMDIYRGIIPFVVIQIVGIILPLLFPAMVLWLPMAAYGK